MAMPESRSGPQGSFLSLGITLVRIGYIYQRFAFLPPRPTKAEVGAET